jgi:hypothetical protein
LRTKRTAKREAPGGGVRSGAGREPNRLQRVAKSATANRGGAKATRSIGKTDSWFFLLQKPEVFAVVFRWIDTATVQEGGA